MNAHGMALEHIVLKGAPLASISLLASPGKHAACHVPHMSHLALFLLSLKLVVGTTSKGSRKGPDVQPHARCKTASLR